MRTRSIGVRWVLITVALGVLGAGTTSWAQEMEAGFDRPGGDYSDMDLPKADPALCRAACEKDGRCLAWTYMAPVPGEAPHCFLKSEMPDPVEHERCTSGVRRAGIADGAGQEPATNRPGGDFRDLALDSPDPELCQRACNRDLRCQAWTYVRPAAEGDKAHCWLKSERPAPVSDEACVSGVKPKHGKELPRPEKTPEQFRL